MCFILTLSSAQDVFTAKIVIVNLQFIKSFALHYFAIFCDINFFPILLNFIWSLFIWRKLEINQAIETFLSKIKWKQSCWIWELKQKL